MRLMLVAAAAMTWFALPESGTAQNTGNEAAQDSTVSDASVFGLELGLDRSVPIGEFSDHVGANWGGGFAFLVDVNELFGRNETNSLAVRLDVSYGSYGDATSEGFVFESSRQIAVSSFGVGPQFNRDVGWALLDVFASVGVSKFGIESRSSVVGFDTGSSFESTDTRPSLTVGGGVSTDLPLVSGPHSLHLSASYRHHGTTEYKVRVDAPTIVSDANLAVFRVGVTFWF